MTDQDLVKRAFEMHRFSYVPYSHFPVGAALLCEDGRVFTGCNVENAAFGSTICAERTALLKAISEGCREGWTAIAIAGTGEDYCWPCGACRQMLYEFAPELRGGPGRRTVCGGGTLPAAAPWVWAQISKLILNFRV